MIDRKWLAEVDLVKDQIVPVIASHCILRFNMNPPKVTIKEVIDEDLDRHLNKYLPGGPGKAHLFLYPETSTPIPLEGPVHDVKMLLPFNMKIYLFIPPPITFGISLVAYNMDLDGTHYEERKQIDSTLESLRQTLSGSEKEIAQLKEAIDNNDASAIKNILEKMMDVVIKVGVTKLLDKLLEQIGRLF